MTAYFFDSSALVKQYIGETGSIWIAQLSAKSALNDIFIAQVTTVEVTSALHRAARSGRITLSAATMARLRMRRHAKRQYVTINLTDEITRYAETLLSQHPLRAYDAIQLATALEAARRFTASDLPMPIFVSADANLLTAAAAEGLLIENPSAHD